MDENGKFSRWKHQLQLTQDHTTHITQRSRLTCLIDRAINPGEKNK